MLLPLLIIAYFNPAPPPAPADVEPARIEIVAEITAYTSSPEETDDTPTLNASGTTPGPGSLACPRHYALGTQFVIEGKRYTCDDRMNKRHADRFDIWMDDREAAIEWGVKKLPVALAT